MKQFALSLTCGTITTSQGETLTHILKSAFAKADEEKNQMAVKVSFSGLDASNEGTSFGVYMVDLSTANFTAQAANLAAVQAAIRGVSKIDFDGASYPAMYTPRETELPTDPYAQRELKWRVSYSDTVNNRTGEFEIGGAELTGIISPGTDFMNLSSTEGAALVTAIETHGRSRDGNAIAITSVKLVGRTS